MILGLSVPTFTLVHVIISLLGIFAGSVVVLAFLSGKLPKGWTALSLTMNVLTSATGFLFHSQSFGPPHITGIIALVVLAVAIFALYGQRLAGSWRWIYVAASTFAVYLNAFVGVTQAFQKIAFLNQFAPTQTEPPFAVTQGLVLVLFVAVGWVSVKRFHPAMAGVSTLSSAR